ncbi:MAG TPA: ATP-binding protein [Gallionella sp.]|nr:ATP-binding protein [Gallionella sp.]
MHRLLARQLRKFGLDEQSPPDAASWSKFLAVIEQNYHDVDQDRYTLERALAISSEEMHQLYRRQKSSYETRLRILFGTIQDMIWLKDPDGVYLACNPMFERFFGASEAEIVGKTDYDFLNKELADFFREHDRLAMSKGSPSVNEEWVTFADDGHRALLESVKTPMMDESGKLIGVLGIARDITRRKQEEEELTRYKDHLEEEVQQRTVDLVLARNAAESANRAKSVFLASMSHELRTPLNAILGFSSVMRKDPQLSQAQRENLDIINRSGEHLLTLINDVLEVAKIEAGRVQVERAPFDLGHMVRDVTDMMLIRAQEKGLQLLLDQSSEFPRYIKGDEARLRQVLINLVGNAVKFTRQGGVTVRFGLKPHIAQQRLVIEVEDSGPGISPEDQQRIFEPFVQVGEPSDQKGTGLGLTITRQFVQLMGGTISLESMPGKGSIFRIEFPVDKVAAAEVPRAESTGKNEIIGLSPGQPEYRILIVEDQLENQLLLSKLMENVGLQIRVAENGVRALELFQSWHPHLIWMDRRMPVMDGLETARHIRELPGGKEVKIIAVTASAFMEQRDEMLNAGMDDFVRKPYRFNEIYECLGRQLGVQYIYADKSSTEEEKEEAMTAPMLAVLPPNLRHELHDALESLESERITGVIQQVAPLDAKLHKSLCKLAANYNYPAILNALQALPPVKTP